MELKSRCSLLPFPRRSGSNRTFMELKCPHQLRHSFATRVLIAPLWNWNDGEGEEVRRSGRVLIAPLWNWNATRRRTDCTWYHRSNRTFMELKSGWDHHPRPRTISSNRTFMELKWRCGRLFSPFLRVLIAPLWNWNCVIPPLLLPLPCSNRTFMELKLLELITRRKCWEVLIAPLWNWNELVKALFGVRLLF